MNIKDLKNKKIGILGFGMEGQAVFRYLKNKGLNLEIFESIDIANWSEKQKSEIIGLESLANTGNNYLDKINTLDVLFVSPGININKIPVNYNILITSQTEFFFNLNTAQIIGVTGTKGKGTTSSLIYNILKSAKEENTINGNIYLTGNIGKVQPLDFLDQLQPNDWVVYELSSFQLQRLKQSPYIGVCLMVTSDHLDYHKDLEEYHHAKQAICGFQDKNNFCIFNQDYPATVKIAASGDGYKIAISKQSMPQKGAYINNENISYFENGNKVLSIDTSNRLLRGEHNLENIAAAVCVAKILNISEQVITKVINNFSGLEHRLQFVAEKHGIKFYNDSISTTPDTVKAATEAFNQDITLILGGSSKGIDLTELVQYLCNKQNIKTIITLGQTGTDLKNLLLENEFKGKVMGNYNNLEDVVNEAFLNSNDGSVVLLSPGFASFDMFKNYQDRGEQFTQLVINHE